MEQAKGVHTLPSDLLWLIFTLNANMFSNPRALTDTRFTSQVCQLWRDILERPFIWGKLIDLNLLCQENVMKDWREEVLRRSQGALLWIRGTVASETAQRPSSSRAFFTSLLSNHWTRIQRLDVDVEAVVLDQTWKLMSHPAPHLETFQLRMYHWHERTIFPRDLRLDLFSDDAPYLRAFDVAAISFSIHASWLSNLRSIALSSPFTLHDTFQALKHMPLLERLILENFRSTTYESSLPYVTLPHLTELVVSDVLEVSTPILAHITPAPGCSLCLNAADVDDVYLSTQVLSDTYPSLSKYIKNFYHTHTATRVSLYCRPEYFIFADQSYPSKAAHFSFTLYLQSNLQNFVGDKLTAFATLLSAFSTKPTSFASVRTLDLTLVVPPAFRTIYTSLLSAFTFPSLDVLKTSETSLLPFLSQSCLKEINISTSTSTSTRTSVPSHSIPFPFPALTTLKLTEPTSATFSRSAPHILFLISRRQDGFPIKVLELNFALATIIPRDLWLYGAILDEEAVGMVLRVRNMEVFREGQENEARDFEAVCGAGRVAQLFHDV